MTHRLAVAHLTAIRLPPPDLIEGAAQAGFDGVGLRLLQATEDSPGYPLMDDPAAMRATLAVLRNTGIAVRDIEFVKITPEIDIAALDPMLDAGAALGAGHVITAPYDDDLGRLADRMALLSERAQARDLGVVLEFFPWTSVPDLATCWDVVRRAGPRVGILSDALHFDRSQSGIDLLGQLPPDRLPFAHLCDAPRQAAYTMQDLLRTAREARLAPGKGEIDLRGFLDALPPGIDLALEVPTGLSSDRDAAFAAFRSLHATTVRLLSDLGR